MWITQRAGFCSRKKNVSQKPCESCKTNVKLRNLHLRNLANVVFAKLAILAKHCKTLIAKITKVGIYGLGQTKERKSALTLTGFKDSDDEECEDVEEDQAQEAGSVAGQEQGWGCQ